MPSTQARSTVDYSGCLSVSPSQNSTHKWLGWRLSLGTAYCGGSLFSVSSSHSASPHLLLPSTWAYFAWTSARSSKEVSRRPLQSLLCMHVFLVGVGDFVCCACSGSWQQQQHWRRRIDLMSPGLAATISSSPYQGNITSHSVF